MISIKNMSIKKRVLLLIMSTSILVSIAISSVSIVLSVRYMKISLQKDLTSIAKMVSDNCLVSITYNIPEDTRHILSSLQRRPSIACALITDAQGDEFARYMNAEFQPDHHPLLSTNSTTSGNSIIDGYMYAWTPIMLDGNQIGTLHLLDNMNFVKDAVRNSIRIICIILALVVVVYYFMMIGLYRLIANPVVHLSEISKQICDSGDYTLRASKETGGEIGTLVDSFNEILTHIEKSNVRLEVLVSELEDKNMELERFTYTVSHELKSPLITIKGFLGQLQKHIKNDPTRIEKDISRIETAADKMYGLLNDLLELSRIGRITSEIQEAKFNDIVDDAISRLDGLIKQTGVKIKIQANMPSITVDVMRFAEVLQNLIENALKFTKDQPSPQIHVGCRQENQKTIFFVQDNGIGINKDYRERVFGLFEQLNPKLGGTGIGLSLIKRIIEIHGGQIWIEDGANGQGATFCFTVDNNKNYNNNGA